MKLVVSFVVLSVASAFTARPATTSFRRSQLQMADAYDFDVAIIGCGVGGHGAALHSRAQDLNTAVFVGGDIGGTCVNRGCVPSKALLAASGRVREMRDTEHLSSLGINVEGEVKYSREGIAAHAKNLANRVKGNLENSLKALGCNIIEGRGILTGKPHEIQDSATGKIYTAKVGRSHISLCSCVAFFFVSFFWVIAALKKSMLVPTFSVSCHDRILFWLRDRSPLFLLVFKWMRRPSLLRMVPWNCPSCRNGSLSSDLDTLDWNFPMFTQPWEVR